MVVPPRSASVGDDVATHAFECSPGRRPRCSSGVVVSANDTGESSSGASFRRTKARVANEKGNVSAGRPHGVHSEAIAPNIIAARRSSDREHAELSVSTLEDAARGEGGVERVESRRPLKMATPLAERDAGEHSDRRADQRGDRRDPRRGAAAAAGRPVEVLHNQPPAASHRGCGGPA
jgi:hypothetical protein